MSIRRFRVTRVLEADFEASVEDLDEGTAEDCAIEIANGLPDRHWTTVHEEAKEL